MGRDRASAAADRSFMPGGRAAPIENSPPGIQTMPAGAAPGADLAFATVGWNAFASASAGRLPGLTSVQPPSRTAQYRCPEQHDDARRQCPTRPGAASLLLSPVLVLHLSNARRSAPTPVHVHDDPAASSSFVQTGRQPIRKPRDPRRHSQPGWPSTARILHSSSEIARGRMAEGGGSGWPGLLGRPTSRKNCPSVVFVVASSTSGSLEVFR